MPVVKKLEEEKIYLPTTEKEENEDDRGYVMVRKKLIASDLIIMSDPDMSTFDRAVAMIVATVTDWNFFGEDGAKLEINEHNIRHLAIEDFTFLSVKIGEIAEQQDQGLATEEKKTSTVTLTPPTPVTNPA